MNFLRGREPMRLLHAAAVAVLRVLLLALPGAWPHVAQAAGALSATDERAAQLQRIQAQRAEASDRHARQRAQCLQVFAVTDCLRRADAEFRRAEADLRRQEVNLNDAQRRDAAQAQISRNEERANRVESRTTPDGAQSAAPQASPGEVRPPPQPPETEEAIQRRQQAEQQQRDEAARVRAQRAEQARQAAEQRRLARERRLEANPQRAPAAPLPVPP